MIRYFDKGNSRLVYVGKAADDAYWDRHWGAEDSRLKEQIEIGNDRFVTGCTKKYLPVGAKIFEGGCGLGGKVSALHRHGYDAYGVDYAKETVKKINQYAPELKIKFGDVRELAFPDDFFDGYWSLGVIEHFYDGYEKILGEMVRVLKHKGYLFITAPVMSPLRKIKARLKKYVEYEESEETKENFYQFAFDPEYIIDDLESRGFRLIAVKPYDGIKGLKDEVLILKPLLQRLYDKTSPSSNLVKKILDIVLRHFTNHMCLFVMQKVGTSRT